MCFENYTFSTEPNGTSSGKTTLILNKCILSCIKPITVRAKLLVQDDVGSGAVHVMGGIAALMGAMMIGPRTGRFDPTLKKDFTERCYSTRVSPKV